MVSRMLVADDHEVVRRGVRDLLSGWPCWEICGEACTGREAVRKTAELKPHLVVMDISMPDLNGLEATRQILGKAPRTEILILTVHDSEQVAREVLQAGARGYILKSDVGRNLVAAIQALLQHRTFFTSRVSEMILAGYLKIGPAPNKGQLPHSRLTPREREILQFLAEGKLNKEVARILGISVKTVEVHRAHIMRGLQLHSTAEMVRYAIRNKIARP